MHFLRVWGEKWGQCTVPILELVPNTVIYAWATKTSLRSMEKSKNWFGMHHDVVGISSTKRCTSDTIKLNEGWKLFCCNVDVTMSA